MHEWEYHSEIGPTVQKMNELGAIGWELVAVQGQAYLFKRPKVQQDAMPKREYLDPQRGGKRR